MAYTGIDAYSTYGGNLDPIYGGLGQRSPWDSFTAEQHEERREWLMDQWRKDPQRLIGEQVYISYRQSSFWHPFEICRIEENSVYLKGNGNEGSAPLDKIVLIRDMPFLSPIQEKKYRAGKLLERWDSRKIQTKLDADNEVVATKNKIERLVKDLEKEKVKVKSLAAKANSIKIEKSSKQDIIKAIAEIKRIKGVTECYISSKFKMFIQTENLDLPQQEADRKGKVRKLGRLEIQIPIGTTNVSDVKVHNLDWEYDSNDHPNIDADDNHVCWGSNEPEVSEMLKNMTYYQLVDFILLFLTDFPQQNGSPYVDYTEWLEERGKKKSKFTNEEKIL
jgi:hypothetical protein